MSQNPIQIFKDSTYLVENGLQVNGEKIQELLKQSQSFTWLEIGGAISMGFIIGWLLGFTNKFVKQDNITVNYFTSIVSALLGASVIGYFANTKLMGVYGITVSVGFFIYTLLYPRISFRKIIYPNYKN